MLFVSLAILGVYLILELYRRRYTYIEDKFLVERDDLNKRIAEKELAIYENNRISDNLLGQIEKFKK